MRPFFARNFTCVLIAVRYFIRHIGTSVSVGVRLLNGESLLLFFTGSINL